MRFGSQGERPFKPSMLADYFAEVEASNPAKKERENPHKKHTPYRRVKNDRYNEDQILAKLEDFQKHLLDQIAGFRKSLRIRLDEIERVLPKQLPDTSAKQQNSGSYPPPIK